MPRKILYVEDDRPTRDAVLQVLTMEGYELEGAKDGIEAIQKIYRTPPDLVLLDLMLPKMNGYQVCRLIKSDPDLTDLPVIALTARSSEEDRVRGILTGADEYIVKPFDIGDLLTHIETWLSRKETPEKRPVMDPFAEKSDEEILVMILSRVNRQLDEQLFEVEKLRGEQSEQEKQLTRVETLRQTLVTLSHYINNAMAGITGNAMLCSRGVVSTDQLIRVCLLQAKRLSAMLNALEKMIKEMDIRTVRHEGLPYAMFDIEKELTRTLEETKAVQGSLGG